MKKNKRMWALKGEVQARPNNNAPRAATRHTKDQTKLINLRPQRAKINITAKFYLGVVIQHCSRVSKYKFI